MKKTLAYVPVLHQGYLDFFNEHGKEVYLIGRSLLDEVAEDHPRFARQIREVDPLVMKRALEGALFMHGSHMDKMNVLTHNSLDRLEGAEVSAPKEDITEIVAKRFLPSTSIHWVTPDPFLRWDKPITEGEQKIDPDEEITRDRFHREVISEAFEEARKSSDWWRQIGAVVVKEQEQFLYTHNRHLPSEHLPYALGDPRTNFSAGEKIELSTALHAEAGLVAHAAREGIALKGADLYVTTFPCPVCAKSVAEAGIDRVFYAHGYSLVRSRELFADYGIEVIRVLMD